MSDVVPAPDGISVGSDLLRVSSLDSGSGRTKGAPLMMEFKVNLETGPFLVSSTRGVLWVSPREPKVRAAFRVVKPEALFQDVIQAVLSAGVSSEWGNVHPLTTAGVIGAIAYVRSYELPTLEILMHPDVAGLPVSVQEVDGEVIRTLCGLPVELADWLPMNTLVILPQDRDYVGFFLSYEGRGVAVVHNASRGIAICQA